ILLCTHCCSALLAKKPHQPKNLLVNFQYYGCKRLDVPTLQSFDCTSPFDLTLISWVHALTITFHYNSQGSHAGYAPEEMHQEPSDYEFLKSGFLDCL
ncbi:hypothetical protein PAXRUDRAFT_173498, partial [Paxillus rubicundulus Ve08.2h10]